ncbi:DsbA family protein [Aquibium oceanicum]|uniref:Disulfide bond formation protein DsbA n=1 Tax=Aquibium oceanicum TaxID=1670800 RepID=A0A1L3SZU7_9HYPH|nr:DsbA family protein [Aquibium oceanicum]APH74953.1 disulfide bond formation protein DsbA [Aquibium oceanicum]
MNRRAVIIATGAGAVAIFAGGAYLYSQSSSENAPVPIAAESSQLVRPHSPILGPATAPVTIVEFFDPSCEACRAFYPTVKQIMATYPEEVRVIIRYTPFHPASEEAIRILEAARRQDKFQRVMEWLLQNQDQWGADGNPQATRAWELAAEVGLDLTKARQDAVTEQVNAVIAQDVADVQAVGIRGTPTFFVNGKPLASFGRQQLEALVKSEVEATR